MIAAPIANRRSRGASNIAFMKGVRQWVSRKRRLRDAPTPTRMWTPSWLSSSSTVAASSPSSSAPIEPCCTAHGRGSGRPPPSGLLIIQIARRSARCLRLRAGCPRRHPARAIPRCRPTPKTGETRRYWLAKTSCDNIGIARDGAGSGGSSRNEALPVARRAPARLQAPRARGARCPARFSKIHPTLAHSAERLALSRVDLKGAKRLRATSASTAELCSAQG